MLILCLSSAAIAQVQGNLPQLIDSANSVSLAQTTPGSIIMPENVAINDTIDVCVNTFDGAATVYAVTDTLGNTYTTTAGTATPSPTDTKGFVYHAYTRSAFAGADTISVAQPAPNTTSIYIAVSRYQGLNGVDGSVATAVRSRPTSGVSALSTTNTTTVNGDILSSCIGAGSYNQDSKIAPSSGEFSSYGGGTGGVNVAMQYQHAPTLGSNTATVNTYALAAFNGPDTFAMQTLAFKPDAIKITDTALPAAGSGVAYFAQLHCVGGTNTLSYSLFSGSLPAGLSLNTTTGQITGSTTSVGATSLGFRCTDGTVTSSTATITLNVYSSLINPTVKEIITNQYDVGGPWDKSASNPSGVPITVSCNDLLLVIVRGVDTHYSDGWVQMPIESTNGATNFVSDSFHSPIRRLEGWIPGNMASPLIAYLVGPIAINGADIITINNNTSASSANPTSIIVNVGTGQVVDIAAGDSEMSSTASGTFGTSYTTLVPNTLLIGASAGFTGFAPGSPPPMSMSGAWTLLSYDNDSGPGSPSLYEWAYAATTQTVSGTVTYSGSSTNYMAWAQLLVPVRPAPALISCTVGAGEKFRRLPVP